MQLFYGPSPLAVYRPWSILLGVASPEGSRVPVGGGAASGSRQNGAPQGRSDRPTPAGMSDELADPQ